MASPGSSSWLADREYRVAHEGKSNGFRWLLRSPNSAFPQPVADRSAARTPRDDLPLADFRFSQEENDDTVEEVANGSSKQVDRVPLSSTTGMCR
jgi:hypothetical protein